MNKEMQILVYMNDLIYKIDSADQSVVTLSEVGVCEEEGEYPELEEFECYETVSLVDLYKAFKSALENPGAEGGNQ
jgi:hypothetical protein